MKNLLTACLLIANIFSLSAVAKDFNTGYPQTKEGLNYEMGHRTHNIVASLRDSLIPALSSMTHEQICFTLGGLRKDITELTSIQDFYFHGRPQAIYNIQKVDKIGMGLIYFCGGQSGIFIPEHLRVANADLQDLETKLRIVVAEVEKAEIEVNRDFKREFSGRRAGGR